MKMEYESVVSLPCGVDTHRSVAEAYVMKGASAWLVYNKLVIRFLQHALADSRHTLPARDT